MAIYRPEHKHQYKTQNIRPQTEQHETNKNNWE